MTLRYKQNQANEIIEFLEDVESGGVVNTLPNRNAVYALALRLDECRDDSNNYFGSDMQTDDQSELFDGHGSLWTCNSRLCPFCVGKTARANRKKIRYAFERVRLEIGEDWFFITYTMPDLALKGLTLEQIAAIKQTAWAKFSHVEPNANKSQTWFQNNFRGGFKSYEFTYTSHKVFHYHLHSLCLGRKKIRHNDYIEIRAEWTKALQFAFKKHGVKWQCDTSDGFAVVNVQTVERGKRENVVNELSKYITKSDSWLKIPVAQIAEIAFRSRFWRMFESFGVCRETVREMNEKPVESEQNAQLVAGANSSNLNPVSYLDTKNLIPSNLPLAISPKLLKVANPPPKKKKRSWFRRLIDKEITLSDYSIELREQILSVTEFRKIQLCRLHPRATFQTADGHSF